MKFLQLSFLVTLFSITCTHLQAQLFEFYEFKKEAKNLLKLGAGYEWTESGYTFDVQYSRLLREKFGINTQLQFFYAGFHQIDLLDETMPHTVGTPDIYSPFAGDVLYRDVLTNLKPHIGSLFTTTLDLSGFYRFRWQNSNLKIGVGSYLSLASYSRVSGEAPINYAFGNPNASILADEFVRVVALEFQRFLALGASFHIQYEHMLSERMLVGLSGKIMTGTIGGFGLSLNFGVLF